MSRDLIKLVHSIGYDLNDATRGAESSITSLSNKNIAVLKSVLTAGFYPRIAKVNLFLLLLKICVGTKWAKLTHVFLDRPGLGYLS